MVVLKKREKRGYKQRYLGLCGFASQRHVVLSRFSMLQLLIDHLFPPPFLDIEYETMKITDEDGPRIARLQEMHYPTGE